MKNERKKWEQKENHSKINLINRKKHISNRDLKGCYRRGGCSYWKKKSAWAT